MENKIFITKSFLETENLGEKFSSFVKNGDLICLYGELGSGKTTFVRGLAKGLKVKSRIISPTFTIIRRHKLDDNYFYHVDFYRVNDEKDIGSLGLNEILEDKDSIKVLEWPEKIKDLLPQERIDIWFEYIDEKRRRITIKNSKIKAQRPKLN